MFFFWTRSFSSVFTLFFLKYTFFDSSLSLLPVFSGLRDGASLARDLQEVWAFRGGERFTQFYRRKYFSTYSFDSFLSFSCFLIKYIYVILMINSGEGSKTIWTKEFFGRIHHFNITHDFFFVRFSCGIISYIYKHNLHVGNFSRFSLTIFFFVYFHSSFLLCLHRHHHQKIIKKESKSRDLRAKKCVEERVGWKIWDRRRP